MMKRIFLLWGCLLLIAMTACEKDTLASIFAPEVETGTAENIYRKGATLSGSIRFSEGMAAESYGILFSKYQSLAESQEMPVTSDETDFSIPVQDLEPNETYYFCSYANSGYSMVRGEVRSFTTSSSNAPVFQTPVVSDTTVSSFHITATLLDDGGSELMLSGFCYGEGSEKLPTFMDQVKNIELSGNSISATITGLYPNTTYQIRAYGASKNGLAYSDLVTVTTQTAVVPFLSSVSRKDSTLYSVIWEASVLESGSAEVTEKGFCYSTNNQEPTINDKKITVNNLSNTFETELEDLTLNTTYYIRAYAVNEFGIGYSETFTYKTAEPKTPVLSAISQTASSPSSVSIQANVMDKGIPTYTQAGFCWSTNNQMPTTNDNKVELSGSTLETTLPNLLLNTTYYIRAYAVNEAGTAYSEIFTYTPVLPEMAYLCTGQTFNERIKQLANDMVVTRGVYDTDNLIKKIEFITEDQTIPEKYETVSADNSSVPIYASFNPSDGLLTISTSAKNMEIVDASYMFCELGSLQTIDFGKFNINENTTNISFMFWTCSSLTTLDVSNWKTDNVTDMHGLFWGCLSLTTLNIATWKTGNVTNMTNMFNNCTKIKTLEVSNWNTSQVTKMEQMFHACTSLTTLDVSNWNTGNLTEAYRMFDFCSSLTTLDVSNWNTEKLMYAGNMFSGCASLTVLDVTKWNTDNVLHMASIFNGCSALKTLDVSNWKIDKAADMSGIFQACQSLTQLNISNWQFNDNIDVTNLFSACASNFQSCEITASKETQEYLLSKISTTNMNPSWFIWTNGTVDDEGSDIEDMPNQEW